MVFYGKHWISDSSKNIFIKNILNKNIVKQLLYSIS